MVSNTGNMDHPRVCGEHPSPSRGGRRVWGSSPRMRGALQLPAHERAPRGIIPAYAGSTGACNRPAASPWDHPRVCGEHCHSGQRVAHHLGSSPRMRGALARRARPHGGRGIIPAYAGSTRRARARRGPWRDHPRVCGEHLTLKNPLASIMGSSPRMRGALVCSRARAGKGGIIPAYAGSTGTHT